MKKINLSQINNIIKESIHQILSERDDVLNRGKEHFLNCWNYNEQDGKIDIETNFYDRGFNISTPITWECTIDNISDDTVYINAQLIDSGDSPYKEGMSLPIEIDLYNSTEDEFDEDSILDYLIDSINNML